MTETTDSTTHERIKAATLAPDDPEEAIVLAIPRGYATIGDPTDPDGERVLELPQPEDGEEFRRLSLPVDEWAAARELLREHSRFDVLEDPTDRDLTETKTRGELIAEWGERQAQKKANRRAEKVRFDPVEDRPANHQRLAIKLTYEALCEEGHEEAAAELRALDNTKRQARRAKALRQELLEEMVPIWSQIGGD